MWVSYIDFITSESKRLSTTQIGAPTHFVTNITSVIACLHGSALTMSKGERAHVTCSKNEAFGDYGIPNEISPGARLMFVLDLIDC